MASTNTFFTLWTNKRDAKQQIRKARGWGWYEIKEVYGRLPVEFSVIIFIVSII
jgi:hypothetical protein